MLPVHRPPFLNGIRAFEAAARTGSFVAAGAEQNGELDPATRQVISTFQMKYRPSDIGGEPDIETAALLDVVSSPGGMKRL